MPSMHSMGRESSGSSAPSPAFSLAQARGIIRDLFDHNPVIYWTDFLVTICAGHAAFFLVQQLGRLPDEIFWWRLVLQAACFAASCALYYRAVMFVHEVVHLPENKFRAFRIVWNALCGVPFLVPSFTYLSHLDHHRRRSYGTREDGEYLSLVRIHPWLAAVYFLQGLFVPALGAFRFLVLTPLTWLSPRLRQYVHQRASSLVMDPTYIRPLPTNKMLRAIRLQELLCFVWCLGIAAAVFTVGKWPYPLLLQGYLTAVVLVTMNAIRTAASHRWSANDQKVTFVEQMLDSLTIDSDSLGSIIINPVGLRYHALHHLFPSLPYHNARAAHKRLMEQLPADSPYRQTVEDSVVSVLSDIYWQAREQRRREYPDRSQERATYERAQRATA